MKTKTTNPNPRKNYFAIFTTCLILISAFKSANAQCQASFYTAMAINNQLKAIFTNTSTPDFAGSTSYFWKFGDGNTSTLKNPTHTYSYPGTYTIWLKMYANNGSTTCVDSTSYTLLILNSTSVSENSITVASLTNYPNPFIISTVIAYSIPDNAEVELEVFDIMGKKIAVVDKGLKIAGAHEIIWDSEGISKGEYFIRLKVNTQILTQKTSITN